MKIRQPVSWSDQALVFDTVSAVKLPYHYGNGPHLYCYFKLYVLGGSLAVSAYVFEREPAPGSVLALAVGACGGERALHLALGAGGASLLAGSPRLLLDPGEKSAAPLESEGFFGNDEQGFYWGRSALVPEKQLAAVGLALRPGRCFCLGAVGKNSLAQGFCASFPAAGPGFSLGDFNEYEVVDY